MSDPVARLQGRINQIKALLGEPKGSNEEFGRELRAVADESGTADGSRTYAGRQATSASPAAPEALKAFIEEAAGKTGLSADLIQAVIATESNYRSNAVSPVGAQGLMQLMPGTARGLGVRNSFDPRENILGGSEYLKQQMNRFGGVEKALAAYNAGPGAVQKYGGIPPYRETQRYVKRVLKNLNEIEDKRE